VTHAYRWHSLALAVIAAIITSCANPHPPQPAAQPAPSETAGVQLGHADTCGRFAIAALSVDTTIDRGPADARLRAAHEHGTPTLAAAVAGEGRDPAWLLLAERQGRVVVTAEPVEDDLPPPQPDRAAAAVRTRRAALDSTGRREPLPDVVIYCELAKLTEGWKVTAARFVESAATEVAP
jgi:hypothetical protein